MQQKKRSFSYTKPPDLVSIYYRLWQSFTVCSKRILWMVFVWIAIAADVSAQEMQYVGTKATLIQPVANPKALFTPCMRIEVQTKGNYTPLSLLHFQLKQTSKKWPAGWVSAKVFCTGTKDSFNTAAPFGVLQNKNGQLSVDGEQALQSGTNFFWIAIEWKQEQSIVSKPDLQFVSCTTGLPQYQAVWADEFDKDGPPDSANWGFEKGFVRNEEDQWYQPENAYCKNGLLTIEARKDSFPNARYEVDSRDWRRNRKHIHYTAASINTQGKHQWTYGRWEMRARLDTNQGCWPAWWALGTEGGNWPANGEIDMMEFYRGKILANYAVATQKPYTAKWYSTATPVADFHKQNWPDSFHHWRMDWDSLGIAIYLDEVLLNYQPQSNLHNRTGNNDYFPFRHPQYMLLNFALGGQNGGDPSGTTFPRRYDIDYVRVLQKVEGKYGSLQVHYTVFK